MQMRHDDPFPRIALFATAMLLSVLIGAPAHAVTHFKRGDVAPGIHLKDLSGGEFATDGPLLRGRTLIVVFGEPYHEKTRQACSQIDAVLRDARFAAQGVTPVLIVTQQPTDDDRKSRPDQVLPPTIVCDPSREAFGAYQVAVMPSIVVIDSRGQVVLAIAGLTDRLPDMLTDALLFATGKLSGERFDASLNPSPTTASAAELRPDRVALLGRQLARRGMDEMAAEKFAEAIKLDAHHAGAHLGMGKLLLKQRRLPQAEAQFKAVLADHPQSVEASLGLAYVQTLRGGAELEQAEQAVRQIISKTPSLAQAHFLLGLISEQRGRADDAAASYKKAAQLLLERGTDAPEGD